MVDTARLEIQVDSSGVPIGTKRLKDLDKASGKAETATGSLQKSWMSFSRLLLVGSVAMGFRFLLKSLDAGQKSLAQLEAGLRSTGGTSGQTMRSMIDLGESMQATTVFADDLVQSTQAILLSFTNIADDVFPRTMRAAADVATRMGIDLKSAVIQLAKALNDPVANLGALSRSGIQFSKDQKEVIKSLWQTGQQAEAQAVILKELEVQYGGSAQAARDTLGGAISDLQNSLSDLAESIGGPVTGSLVTLISAISETTTGFAKFFSLITGGGTFRRIVDDFYELEEAGLGVAEMQGRVVHMEREQTEASARAAEALAVRTAAAAKLKDMLEQRRIESTKIVRTMEHEIIMMQKSAEAQAAYMVFLAGGSDELMKRARELALIREEYAQQEKIKEWIAALKEERNILGMSAGEKAFYTAMTRGATRAQAIEISTLVESAEARRAGTEADRAAVAIVQSLASEEERIIAQMEAINAAELRGAITTEAWAEAFNTLIDRLEGFREEAKETEDVAIKSATRMQNMYAGLAGSITDAALNMEKDFSESFAQIAEDFAKMVARMLVQQAVLSAFGVTPAQGQAVGRVRGSALGNVFSGGSIVPFRRGGVVTGPTIFPMARGAGLMGEAGPEAVMPLTRTPKGELGVKAEGVAPVVNVNITNNTGAPVTQSQRQTGEAIDIDIAIGNSINNHIEKGTTDKAMRNAYGVSRRGVGR